MRELGRLYAARTSGGADPLPPLAMQYADHAQVQHDALGGVLERAAQRRLQRRRGGEVQLPRRDDDDGGVAAALDAHGEGLGDREFAHERGSVSLAMAPVEASLRTTE